MNKNNLDDVLETGDLNRQYLEDGTSVHGLIAYFLANPECEYLDLEAQCLEIIRNKFDTFPEELRKDIWEYIEGEDDVCTKCNKVRDAQNMLLCEHTDEWICTDCCGVQDICPTCYKIKNKNSEQIINQCVNRAKFLYISSVGKFNKEFYARQAVNELITPEHIKELQIFDITTEDLIKSVERRMFDEEK